MARPLYIDPMIFYQLLADLDALHAALPATLEPLRESGKAAYAQALKIAKGEDCAGCGSIRQALIPVFTEYAKALAGAQAADPALLTPFVAYVAKRRGFRPTPIVMYYQDEGGRKQALTI